MGLEVKAGSFQSQPFSKVLYVPNQVITEMEFIVQLCRSDFTGRAVLLLLILIL